MNGALDCGEEWTVHGAIFEEIERRLVRSGSAREVEVMPSTDPVSVPAHHIYDQGDQAIEAETETDRFRLTVTIESYSDAEGGLRAQARALALSAKAVTALFEGSEAGQVLGGLAEEIMLGSRMIEVAPAADVSSICITREIIITGAMRRGDPARAA